MTGKVVDDQDRRVAGAAVDCYYYQVSPRMTGSFLQEPEFNSTRSTDDTGAFEVAAGPGATLVLVKSRLRPPGKPGTSCGILFRPLVLKRPTSLSGMVTDENHKPVADAEVWVFTPVRRRVEARQNDLFGKPARETFSTRSGPDGRFRIVFPAGR